MSVTFVVTGSVLNPGPVSGRTQRTFLAHNFCASLANSQGIWSLGSGAGMLGIGDSSNSDLNKGLKGQSHILTPFAMQGMRAAAFAGAPVSSSAPKAGAPRDFAENCCWVLFRVHRGERIPRFRGVKLTDSPK